MKITLTLAIAGLLALSSASDLLARAETANVGQALPELKLDYVGTKPEVAGKPMILEFWATWCGPCRTSIPHLNELYKKHKDKGLVIVGVTDEDEATIKKFTAKVPIDYFPATDKGKLGEKFGIQGIPHAMLVNKSGKIVWEGHPMQLKDADLEQILK